MDSVVLGLAFQVHWAGIGILQIQYPCSSHFTCFTRGIELRGALEDDFSQPRPIR